MNCYCVNLDERVQKWADTQIEAEKLGLKPIRFPAIRMKPGFHGCRESHLKLLRQVKSEGVFMIIEDDILVCYPNPLQVVQKALSQLPHNWDMLYFGATLNQPLQQYSENLYRIKKGWTTHAIIYNNQNGVVDYILDQTLRKIDVFYADDVQENYNCFITYPLILTQREGYSDVINKPVDYEVIKERYKEYVK